MHTLKKQKKQTDASVEHLGCYLRKISPHKGTFIGLPSICGVQEQTLESSDRWWSYRGWGGGWVGVVVVVDKGCGEVLVGDSEGGEALEPHHELVFCQVCGIWELDDEENTEEREHRRWVC